jgi:hypothetical protein
LAFRTIKIVSARICGAATLLTAKREMQTERSYTMGDKGGKKDKKKDQKQKLAKQKQKAKKKQDNQQKSTP